HSLQWEMIRLGQATIENVDLHHPRNVITRCIGPDPDVRPDLEGPFPVFANDAYVICSDGLTNHVSDSEIGQIVSCLPVAESCRLLINLANCRGGSDNSTVVVVHVDDYPQQNGEAAVDPMAQDFPVSTPRRGRKRFHFGAFISVPGGIACEVFAWRYFQRDELTVATVLAITGGLLWIISYLFVKLASAASPATPSSMSETPLEIPVLSQENGPPYRTADARPTATLTDLLAQIQSELIQAARDGAWVVDFDEVATLGKQAAAAQKAGKIDRVMHARGKAIDLLMKELYALRGRS
ncbi:MAG: hypothetical protein KDA85_19250, partial [Planctomycetaceae bacterium]|nr:hypothetical protein [Planctomycetaceae bacterium]